jgi:hypothetical protein
MAGAPEGNLHVGRGREEERESGDDMMMFFQYLFVLQLV